MSENPYKYSCKTCKCNIEWNKPLDEPVQCEDCFVNVKKLRDFRKETKLNRVEFSEKYGVKVRTLDAYESGRYMVHPMLLKIIDRENKKAQ